MSASDIVHPTSFIHRMSSLLCHAEGLITTIDFVNSEGIGNIYNYTWNVWYSFMITVLCYQYDNAALEIIDSDCSF